MRNLVCSASNKEQLTALINKFYYSENYFINDDNQAENQKTGKKFGKIEEENGRFKYLI